MGSDAGRQVDNRFEAPPERWSNDALIWRAEGLAAGHWHAESVTAITLRELARRYRVAIENERRRWESARRAFGPYLGGE